MPAVTVIVPTLNEAGNIEPLVQRLVAAFGPRDDWEILFIDDDSSDGTGTEIRKAAVRNPVHLIVREGERGLASAVQRGFESTSAPVVVVMDADLSHPPEVAPKLAEAVEAGADVAIGSRYVPGGGTEGWSRMRRFLSRGAALLTRGLTSARDPGAGFFAIQRSLIAGKNFKVEGFKILLEILAKIRPEKVSEVPIQFAPRHAGKSKVAAGTAIAYVKQLVRLYAARPAARVLAVIGLLFALKVFLGARTELDSTEAYHWLYAQHPALGYYDHPGMIGWLIWLSTALFGDSPLGVRMFTFISSAVATWLVFLTGRRLYDERAGGLAAMLFAVTFGTLKFGSMATPDAPLLLFWVAALWAMSHAIMGCRTSWWVTAGVFTGLALLSKYTAIFLPAGVFLFLLFSREHRFWLRRKEPYLAVFIALIVFSPTILWNAQHDWQSFDYQGVGRLQDQRPDVAANALGFARRQAEVMTPFVALWAWGAALLTIMKWPRVPWPSRFLTAAGLPMLIAFSVVALGRSARGHWILPGAVALYLLVAVVVVRGGRLGKWLIGGTVAVCMLGALAAAGGYLLSEQGEKHGWRALAKSVDELRPDFVIAQDYHVAAHMAYHLRPRTSVDFTAVGWGGKSFQNWWRGSEFAGRDAVIVYEAKAYPAGLEQVRKYFASVDEPVDVKVGRFLSSEPEPFKLVRARSYRLPDNAERRPSSGRP
ncbi:MAG TPA: glycosyltransferase family 39 protein [Planctomycetota bacterium]|nr:glycosyltransferase family 39 protein [Planctomycetota bacterium]